MAEKPVIFVSHATTDKPIVDILKAQIDRVFANGVNVFASSVPSVIKSGADWLHEVRDSLDASQVVIVLITPVSINRPWIWFEVGASWSKMDQGKGRICPLCVPEIELKDLPEPLSRLQARSLGKAEHVRLFFQELCDQFGFGNMKGFRGSQITSQLPKYTDLKINQIDLNAGTLYTGPYAGYSVEELEEIIIENYLHKSYSDFRGSAPSDIAPLLEEVNFFSTPLVKLPRNIFDGLLVHYRELDETLKLPPGTSKALLKKLAHNYGLIPIVGKDFENTVRFEYKSELDTHAK